MNATGIDVSSRKSMVAVLRPFGEVVMLPFEVRHDAKSLLRLAQTLRNLDGETRVVMEHTGRYYEPIPICYCNVRLWGFNWPAAYGRNR